MDFSGSEDSDEEILGMQSVVKYQKIKETQGVNGFVVNVHDATNFDIDMNIDEDLRQKYKSVITNEYYYKDLPEEFLTNPQGNPFEDTSVGLTYRCRLKGIGINNNLSRHAHLTKSNQLTIEVKQLTDRTDGWVLCTLSDIDIYRRLLVDLVFVLPEGRINLKDFLLKKMESERDPLFYNYVRN